MKFMEKETASLTLKVKERRLTAIDAQYADERFVLVKVRRSNA
jgi:hypothetical protein